MGKNVFALHLEKRMKKNGITRVQLANATKIPAARIASWMLDSNTRQPVIPNINDLMALSKYFNSTVEELWHPEAAMTLEELKKWADDHYLKLTEDQKQQLSFILREFS